MSAEVEYVLYRLQGRLAADRYRNYLVWIELAAEAEGLFGTEAPADFRQK